MKVSMIAAIGKNRELGKNNKLLWRISEDLKRFRQLTTNHVVIMGRKTFESIGKPLPNRTNIVITRNQNFTAPGCMVVQSLEEAINEAKQKKETPAFAQASAGKETFIIGGGEIYKQAIGLADKLYLTVVDATADADTFFPDYREFSKIVNQSVHHNPNLTYTFLELIR